MNYFVIESFDLYHLFSVIYAFAMTQTIYVFHPYIYVPSIQLILLCSFDNIKDINFSQNS